jgi:uncharacterized protein YjbJ (UPF0337 family)
MRSAVSRSGQTEPFQSSRSLHNRLDGNSKANPSSKEVEMADNLDEAKGRAKRAVGELTDDDRLKQEGTIDKSAGKAKESIDKAADKAKGLMEND